MKICFATNNQHKLEEIRSQLSGKFELLSLKDINCFEDLPENQETLKGNSEEKAAFVYQKYKLDCFADDTGLEVEALGGEPGVYSARYAGQQRNSENNIKLLLKNLFPYANRNAQFKTVISLYLEGDLYQFEGVVKGEIIKNAAGLNGFGYDPIFVPEGSGKTFATMTMKEKNSVSHRARAFDQLVKFLSNY